VQGPGYEAPMPVRTVAGRKLWFEAPEAGRYKAPILAMPGLFQSFECWRSLTSMLAHRGWAVYGLGRWDWDRDGDLVPRAGHWDELVEQAQDVSRALEGSAIVLAADVSAAIAIALARQGLASALALFAPVPPAQAFARAARCRGWIERWRGPGCNRTRPAGVDAPAIAAWGQEEPAGWFDSLEFAVVHDAGARQAPIAIFEASEDPLVEATAGPAWIGSSTASVASTRLRGRWWPAQQGAAVAAEVHRFLILTLGDRIVEFPEEIFQD
jgi:hypothetical protein